MLATIKSVGLGCLLGALSFAVQASEEWLTSKHPENYVVKEGDTLWDVAGQFLNEPWRWREVWKSSPTASNPNLIYPGDVIVLSYNDAHEPELSVQSHNSHQQATVKMTRQGDVVEKLSPRVRVLPSQQAIPTIPLSVIGPFLSQTRILEPGYLDHAYEVAALDDEHILVGAGQRFYVKNLHCKPGEMLSVYKKGGLLIHPKTGKVLGEEASYLGMAEVEKPGNMTRLLLKKSEQEIRTRDKVLPLEKTKVDPYFLPKLPNHRAQGYILSVLGGINQVGQNQVVTITGGRDCGREEGDVLDVYQSKEDFPTRVVKEEEFEKQRYPAKSKDYYHFSPLKVGRVIVFRVYGEVSLALVTDATRPIYLHDEVKRP